jgi:hypothetical protein
MRSVINFYFNSTFRYQFSLGTKLSSINNYPTCSAPRYIKITLQDKKQLYIILLINPEELYLSSNANIKSNILIKILKTITGHLLTTQWVHRRDVYTII